MMKAQHEQASKELSRGKRNVSNLDYRNWNKTAYIYNRKKKRFEFKENLGRSYDVPKYIYIRR